MKIQCAWCKKSMGEKIVEGNENQNGKISHGICSECMAIVLKKED